MPFKLYPQLPGADRAPHGVDKKTFFDAVRRSRGQDPDSEEFKKRRDGLHKMWNDEGLTLSDGGKTGSSFDAHRLVSLARKQGVEEPMAEALWKAYHTDDECISDHEVLLRLANQAGVVGAKELLESNQEADEVNALYHKHTQMGIDAVPFLMVDDKITEMGGRSVPWLENLFQWVIEKGDYTPLEEEGLPAGTSIPKNERRRLPEKEGGEVFTFEQFVDTMGLKHSVSDLTKYWVLVMEKVSAESASL